MRFKKLLLLGGGLTTAGVVNLARNDWDINSIGVIRLGRAVYTAGAITADYKMNVYSKKMPDDPEAVKQMWDDAHKRSAEKILDLCRANRGVFVKVGQHIGALDYLLPPPYIETLRILHSQAPSSSLEEVFSVIREDLKIKETETLFSEFEMEPLGAASLAQVYKAKLKSGETVAVKVQHAKVQAHSFVDMKTMEILVRTAAWLFPDFKLVWLVDETKKNLPMELDFLNEGHNADKIRDMLSHHKWLRIPKIYWEHSTKRVLIMEYCEGGQINDLSYMKKHKINTADISEKIGILYSEMIFTRGFVHCDPHPGNLLVWDNPTTGTEICLLDHGLYTTLSPEFRYNYSQFWLSIINSNVEGIKTYGEELGVGELYGLFACMVTGRSWESITAEGGVTKKLTHKEEQAIRTNVSNYLPQISEILERVPRPMILIFKTNDLIRGIEHSLHTQKTMKSFTTMSKVCVNTIYTEKLRKCMDSRWMCFRYQLIKHFILAKINIFEFYLWFRSLLSPIFGFASVI